MFAAIQFPLMDVRPFLDEETHRVTSPVWPIVHLPDEPHRAPFVRGFGRACWRSAGGVDEWPAEDAYCDFSNGMRFVRQILADAPGVLPPGWRRYCAFRRLFWDGQLQQAGSVVGRVELGFGMRPGQGVSGPALGGEQVGRLLDGLLKQSVRVEPGTRPEDSTGGAAPAVASGANVVSLSSAGGRLAAACLRRSTHQSGAAVLDQHAWWLQAGSPLMVVEYTRGQELESLPARTVPVRLEGPPFQGFRVFLGKRTVEGRERPVWFFEREPDHGGNRDTLRRLRINITRLHAALSGLRILADLQQKQKLTAASAEARDHLKTCLGGYLPILFRHEALGFGTSEFLTAALSMTESLRPQELASLRQLEVFRGRGLRDQMDRATEAVSRGLNTSPPPIEWDVFIAHAGPDRVVAESLFDLLQAKARVFLDSRRLQPGDLWNQVLPRAQERSYMTVVLLGENPDRAYYLQSEIASAISLARIDGERHRVVPVYLGGEQGRARTPYGLNLQHGIVIDATTTLAQAADQILGVISQRKTG